MRILLSCTILILFMSLLVLSCASDEANNEYEGVNRVYLTIIGEKLRLEEEKDTPLTIEVEMTNALKEDLELTFAVLNDEKGVIRLENNPVTIQTGETKGRFTVRSNCKGILTQDAHFRIGFQQLPAGMQLDQELLLLVEPDPAFAELNEAQKTLIASYKAKYGIDLMQWMGLISCHTKVMSPVSERSINFAKAFTKEFDGQTVITLSEKATEEQPVLKMTNNPLGLNPYMEWVLQRETVFNDEYWFAPGSSPAYAAITELLKWNKQNPGIFSMTLDDIRLIDISEETASFEVLGTKKSWSGDDVPTIPFVYSFSPWEKQKQLIAEGNLVAKELKWADGTSDPDYYLMTYSVLKADDGIDETDFIPAKGKIDFKNRKMTFQFSMSHSLADGYTRVYVTYEKK